MHSIEIPYSVLCSELITNGHDVQNLRPYFEREYPNLISEQIETVLSELKKRFMSHFLSRWNAVHRKKSHFEKKYTHWLEGVFEVELTQSVLPETSTNMGRPRKSFDECCDRAKRYKRDEIRNIFPQEEINYAATSESFSCSQFDPDKALALFIQAELSKRQYEVLRHALKDEGHDVFPPYIKLVEAKKSAIL